MRESTQNESGNGGGSVTVALPKVRIKVPQTTEEVAKLAGLRRELITMVQKEPDVFFRSQLSTMAESIDNLLKPDSDKQQGLIAQHYLPTLMRNFEAFKARRAEAAGVGR